MGYESALAAAGAKVLNTHYAGSYQGTWGCIVEYNNKKGLVTGSYGSCSVCDAFQSEFDAFYSEDINSEDLQKRLANFGQSYLQVIQEKFDVQNQLDNLSKVNDSWYEDEQKELLEWALPQL
jgi:hypothetical protein